MGRLLVTGAAGQVAQLLIPRLVRPDRHLRLLDIRESPTGAAPGEWITASITDPAAMTRACTGVDGVVHLGGQPGEAPIEEVLRLNAYGTYCVLEAARRARVPRVVLASSSHAAGFHTHDDAPPDGLPADVPARPDTLYGWSKVAAESLGRLYSDRYGIDVTCVRIGTCSPAPEGPRQLAHWLSPDDGARLVEACLSHARPGYRIVWGISRNARRWWSLAEGEAIGYHPEDDAEEHAAGIIAAHGEPDFVHDRDLRRVGGAWCDIPLGEYL